MEYTWKESLNWLKEINHYMRDILKLGYTN